MERLKPTEAKAAAAEGTCLIVDVREPDEFRAEHIAGATNLALSTLLKDPSQLRSEKKVVLCCRSGMRAAEAYKALSKQNELNCSVLDGGLLAWKKAKLPLEEDKQAPIPLQRQVQIVAGSLVAIGTLLGLTFSLWFLFIPLFVGSGLIFAGISGTCAMASLLRKLPFNHD